MSPKGEIAGSSPAGDITGPSGLMDKALVSGAKDCGFESHLGWYTDNVIYQPDE